jgi:hypothetical protein
MSYVEFPYARLNGSELVYIGDIERLDSKNNRYRVCGVILDNPKFIHPEDEKSEMEPVLSTKISCYFRHKSNTLCDSDHSESPETI